MSDLCCLCERGLGKDPRGRQVKVWYIRVASEEGRAPRRRLDFADQHRKRNWYKSFDSHRGPRSLEVKLVVTALRDSSPLGRADHCTFNSQTRYQAKDDRYWVMKMRHTINIRGYGLLNHCTSCSFRGLRDCTTAVLLPTSFPHELSQPQILFGCGSPYQPR